MTVTEKFVQKEMIAFESSSSHMLHRDRLVIGCNRQFGNVLVNGIHS